MKKTAVAIFAHPDDEAFGPAGTLHLLTKTHDVYILCATKGGMGGDGNVRANEMIESSKILGIKKVYFLGFKDGNLCNNHYHKLADKIKAHLNKLKPEIIITYEPLGVSGHIDHITMSMVTTFVFKRFPSIKKLMYYCLPNQWAQEYQDYFIYFPSGYSNNEIDEIIDVEDVWDIKIKAMKTHISQIADAKKILEKAKTRPKQEHFLVIER